MIRIVYWMTLVLSCCALQGAMTGEACAQIATFMRIADGSGHPMDGPDITPDGTPGAVSVQEFHHLLTTLPDGSAIEHHPLIVTKRIDRLTASLHGASLRMEHLGVTLQRFSGGSVIQELELVGALVVGIEPISITSGAVGHYERIRFQYTQIMIRDLLSGTQTILVVPATQ